MPSPNKSKRRVRVTEYEQPEETQHEEMPLVEMDSAEDTYQSFMTQFAGDGVKVKVYRQTATGKQYCYWGTPAEVDEESIRLYHARQPWANESATYLVHVEVRGEFRNSFPVLVGPQVSTPGSQSSNGDGQMQMMFKMLMDQNARLEQRLLQNSRQEEREPINDIADAMLKLSQLQQQQAAPMPIDTLMKCIELGRTLNGDGAGDWKSTLLEVVKESMPAISGMIASMPKNNIARMPNPSQDQPKLPVAVNETEGTLEQLQAQLKGAIAFLKRKCLAGSDPGLYIDWVIENREATLYAQLIHAIVSQPFPAFVQIDPEISKPPYEAFFTALYNGIRDAFGSGGDMDVDTGQSGGDNGNVTSHAGAGKTRKQGS